jgi:hypothetical protein
MVDTVIRLTVLVVLGLALVNALHAASVFVRFSRHVVRHGGVDLWLPAFGSGRDVRIWLGRWRALLDVRDPALAVLRVDARLVIGRHVQLTLLSNTWAIALSALAPGLV